jgi:hypothetical protein
MIILHGDNLVASRQQLVTLLATARSQKREVQTVDAARLTLSELETITGSHDLFETPKTIVIEELHSLPTSQRKTDLLESIANYENGSPIHDLILWEKRTLTATMLKRFPGAAATQYKVNAAVFTWLDALSPGQNTKKRQLQLLREAIKSEDSFMCLAMLIRQVRMLIQIQDKVALAGAPFMLAKLQKQAQLFEPIKLLALHRQLLEVDRGVKTGSSLLSLDQHLDLLVLDL